MYVILYSVIVTYILSRHNLVDEQQSLNGLVESRDVDQSEQHIHLIFKPNNNRN